MRYAVRLDATFAVAGAALVHHASGETLDLSENGCLLRVAATVAQGRRVRVAMMLPGGRVVVAGTVHWATPEGRMGICFDRRVALPAQLQSYLEALAANADKATTTTQRIAGLPPLTVPARAARA